MASEEPSVRSPSASPAPESLQARIAARLAAIDTESEDDEPKTTSSKGKKSPRPTQDSDSEEEIVRRPRGRLAAQMQAGGQRSDSEEPESFLDRIQKRLEATEEADDNDAEDTVMGEAEDEDDIPVARRRLQKKPARETTPKPQSPARSPTPGLFVSPEKQSPTKLSNETTANDSDSDASLPALKNSRFQALVERKRQERLAREAEEEKKKAERMERQVAVNADLFDDEDDANVSDITDDEGGRKLSQAARPARKAGKKAIEEMNRETQRMARNMQLAHEAKTRKKFTKADFLDRFNFRKTEAKLDPKTTSSSRPTTPVSAPQTDAEMKDSETPPSSPPVPKASTPSKEQEATTTAAHAADTVDDNEELPSLDGVFENSKKLDKGKGKAVAVPSPKKSPAKETKPKRQVRIKMPSISAYHTVIDLDDDLEITDIRKAKLAAVFNSIPQKKSRESNSLHALRRLAQVGSPERSRKGRHEKPGMTVGELQLTLQQRARQQAKLEREKRLEYLKSKGVVVQTAEEREREMQDVEDIVARARREAEEIMARERDAAKQEKKEKRKNGELDPFDDSDDEEYEGSDEEVGDDVELELSGSEEEAEDASDNEAEGNALVDDEAGNSGSEHSDVEADDITGKVDLADSEDEMGLPTKNVRRSKKTQVISDDEDENDVIEATPRPRTATQQSPAAPNTKSPAVPTSVLRSAKKTFIPGLPVTGAAGLGLTQIFAGTMDDSQAAPGTIPSQSPMPDFDSLPDSLTIGNNTQQDSMILDSQGGDGGTQRFETQQDSADGVHLHFTQSQAHGFDSLMRDDEPATQISMDATQDEGLQDYTPLRSRFVEAPASTVETMVLDGEAEHDTVLESPLVRRGRLRRKIDVTAALAEEEEEETQRAPSPEVDEFGFNTTTAFNVMKEAIKKQEKQKKLAEYNRKKSKAKEMVEEQAEESEDEYAGLGGLDGEDSDDDDAASVKEMIDDQSGMNAGDERKIAALHAERERAADEKMVDKLFHDVTTGMLRRKRGADYDLSDSDDGGEARRRMKRRQFQKMQQALFADERIKKIAEKPGNQAFLRTIEDRGSDDEMDFLHIAAPESMQTEQSQSQDQTVPDSQPTDQRQPLGSNLANRPAANLRRTKDGKKPSNLGEIRESVSSLLEDFNVDVIPATDPASDSEADEEGTSRSNKEDDSPGRNPRRTNSSSRPAVVDRISLKRQSSSMSTSSSKLAFAMPGGGASASSSGSFKVPALLRRATTNSSSFNKSGSGGAGGSNASAGTPFSASGGGSSGFGDDGKIKKNASKRSGVSALARENERRAAIQENEKRREARKWKGAERRISAVGGLFGAGKFE
ncbi:MRC1-like domain-containing protein [Colletotrichum karsti]|uniref:MRC1-like domain-containing protein n=1 Tax=Colletotrichum karsti TaxID=1095194 RepID=A0A9P6IEW4_9PEZI|nr:MRC1-like domain-containing protein [Colletotrichum karsti]KAF9882218.1 MRC1-like domain-containing protein [Colletotrichum karsti]